MLLVLLWCSFCSGLVFARYSASFGGLSARENCGCDGLTGCGLFRAPSLLFVRCIFMLCYYRDFFIWVRDSWYDCNTVGYCVLFILYLIFCFPLFLLFSPIYYLFSLPVHRGDKK